MAIHFPWTKSEDAVEHVIDTVRHHQVALNRRFRIDAKLWKVRGKFQIFHKSENILT